MDARIYPAHFIPHFFLDQSYGHEARSRINSYKKRLAAKDGNEQTPAVLGQQVDLQPLLLALKFKRAEEAENRRIEEEVRRGCMLDVEKTWPIRSIDPGTRHRLYDGVWSEEEGRYRYLKERERIIPEKRVPFPWTSSWSYGWKLTDNHALYNKPSHARLSIIETSFYGRNGIPRLQHDMPIMKMVSNPNTLV